MYITYKETILVTVKSVFYMEMPLKAMHCWRIHIPDGLFSHLVVHCFECSVLFSNKWCTLTVYKVTD